MCCRSASTTSTQSSSRGITDKQVSAIDTERALLAPERVRQVVEYTREHFDQKTKRGQHYSLEGKRVHGFNALFATASINAAKRYYTEFKNQQEDLTPDHRLKVGTIFSYAANEAVGDDFLDEEGFETSALDRSSQDFLEEAIQDYNAIFSTSFDTSVEKFQNYYKDLSERLKKREINLVIVVNMFLTGFDATTMNTLFVDKRLVNHGLIQAYSRTNRILNSVKAYGNIVSFRDLEEETNEAIALFGNKDARGIVVLKPYAEYYAEYTDRASELLARFPLGQPIIGEAAQKAFIALYGVLLRLKNILTSFDEFAGNQLLTERQSQDYRSVYLDLYVEFRTRTTAEKESIVEDIVFEIELIKQIEINVDYILMLVQKWRDIRGDGDNKQIAVEKIQRAIDSSLTLRNKKDLIMAFVDRVSASGKIDEEWRAYVAARRVSELDDIIAEEGLKPEETKAFIDHAFSDGRIPSTGTAITRILPPVSKFAADGGYGEKKQRVLARLGAFFERFFGLGGDQEQLEPKAVESGDPDQTSSPPGPLGIVAQPPPGQEYRTYAHVYSLKVAAGGFRDIQHVDVEGWLEVSGVRLRPGMFVAQAVGHSMEPSIPDGSWCLFRDSVEGSRNGKTLLVQHRDIADPETGGSYTLKRYRSTKVPDGAGSWRHVEICLEPTNPEFQPIVLTDVADGDSRVIAELVRVLGSGERP